MRTRKWAASLAVTALALGLIGAGVAATFTDAATATQQIGVGYMSIELRSSTPGATLSADGKSLTCPTVTVVKSMSSTPGSGQLGCNIQIISTGAITPGRVNLSATTVGNIDLSKFWIDHSPWAPNWNTGGSGGLFGLPLNGGIDFATSFPAQADEFVSWANLTQVDMGTSATVTYTIEAVE